MDGGAVPGQISSLFQHIAPAVPENARIDEAVETDARYQVHVLRSASPVIRDAVAARTVIVQPAVYGLEDGRVRILD